MKRRTYLRSAGVAGLAAAAGCLDSLPGQTEGSERTVLGPPEQDLGQASHPSYGDDFPDVTLPDPLAGEEISTADYEGERAFLFTFIYTNCHDGSCPMLLSKLTHAQHEAVDEGYADETAFLAMTFDPERDDEEALREEAETQDVDREADNWHFLRPESFEEASEILEEEFGLALKRENLDSEETETGDDDGGHDHDEETETGEDDDGHDHDGETETGEDGNTDIVHYNLILLVNRDGVVERAYPNATEVDWSKISGDMEAVVDG